MSSSTMPIPTNRPPTHPGAMVEEEFLKPLGISPEQLATRIGVSVDVVDALVRGERSIDEDLAAQLEPLFGIRAQFWLNGQLSVESLSRGPMIRRYSARLEWSDD